MASVIKFEKEERQALEVHVQSPDGGESVYQLPLSGSLNMGESMGLMKAYDAPEEKRDNAFFVWFYDFACRNVSKVVVDSLTTDQFRQLADTWQSESQAAGASLGE